MKRKKNNIIIMGVSGCGKSTVGMLLANQAGLDYFDADDFHPQFNIDKMKNNIPLTDEDRLPWLNNLAANMVNWEKKGGFVLACSALKESYRQILTSNVINVSWIYLSGSQQLIRSRLELRNKHYMKASLLQTQFDALEVPSYGLHLSIDKLPQKLVEDILLKINLDE